MIHRQCAVPHCGHSAASVYSRYCRHHKSRHRRQGSPNQSSISKTEIKPYLAVVRSRIARNTDSPLWPELDRAWGIVVSDARVVTEKRVGNRYERSAAYEVLNIDADASTREIVTTSLAMFILWHQRPGRFADDGAFWMQLARRVRALSSRHRGAVYDHATGQQRPVYREMTLKAGIILGRRLASAFGFAGLKLAELEERDRQEAEQSRQTIVNAIEELI